MSRIVDIRLLGPRTRLSIHETDDSWLQPYVGGDGGKAALSRQHTSRGRVSGVQGMVDCDWFAGSRASLRAL